MSKNLILTLIIIILTTIAVFVFYKKPSKPLSTIKLKLGNSDYNLEIAQTIIQKSKGLSNRNNLCPNCGMIFVFNQDAIQPFWMKNTFIPLDMIWINSNGQITDIITATGINSTKILQNTKPAKYVIELNAHDTQKLNLKIGDIIDIPNSNEIKK